MAVEPRRKKLVSGKGEGDKKNIRERTYSAG